MTGPTTLLLAPWNFRPSYGPTKYLRSRTGKEKKCLTFRGFRKDFLNFPAKPRVVRTLSLLKIMAQSRGLLSQLRRQSSLHFGPMFVGVASYTMIRNLRKSFQKPRDVRYFFFFSVLECRYLARL